MFQQVLALEVNGEVLELFLHAGVQGPVGRDQGVQGHGGVLVVHVGPDAPAATQFDQEVCRDAPVVRVLLFVLQRGDTVGVGVLDVQVGIDPFTGPGERVVHAHDVAVGGVHPGEHLVLALVNFFHAEGLVHLVELAGIEGGRAGREPLVAEFVVYAEGGGGVGF